MSSGLGHTSCASSKPRPLCFSKRQVHSDVVLTLIIYFQLYTNLFLCGKGLNLLKICSPAHFLFSSGVSIPKISLTFTEHVCQLYTVMIDDRMSYAA